MKITPELSIFLVLFLAFILAVFPESPKAQQPTPTPGVQTDNQIKKKTKRRKKAISNAAEFEGAGALQVEFGYDSNFYSKDLLADQSGSISIQFSASDRLQLTFDMDGIASQTDRLNVLTDGIGDIRFGLQFIGVPEKKEDPALAFGYTVKLPSASAAKGLGSGRYDNKFTLLLSKKIEKTDVDFNVSYLNNGRADTGGRESGLQSAISFSKDLKKNYGLQCELGGQTIDDDQPRGIFALGGFSYQFNPRFGFDAGMRFGLNPSAPRFGVFAGITIGLANVYKR